MPLTLRTLFETYREAMALVEGRNDEGDTTVGSAFHLGAGFYATARHVLDDCKVDLVYPEGMGQRTALRSSMSGDTRRPTLLYSEWTSWPRRPSA